VDIQTTYSAVILRITFSYYVWSGDGPFWHNVYWFLPEIRKEWSQVLLEGKDSAKIELKSLPTAFYNRLVSRVQWSLLLEIITEPHLLVRLRYVRLR